MLVIRPSANKNRPIHSNLHVTKKPIIVQITSLSTNNHNLTNSVSDLDTASSSSTGINKI